MTASTHLPATFTPVFDSSNRWAALRANLAPDRLPDAGLVSALFCAATPEEGGAALPLIVRIEHLSQWMETMDSIERAPAPLHMQVSRESLQEVDAPRLAVLAERGVTLVLEGIPEASDPDCTFAADAAGGVGIRGLLISRFKGPHLVTGINDHATHHEFVHAGFQWFEGCWPLQAQNDAAPKNATSRSTLLNLLGLVATDGDSHEIEKLLKREMNLSYQLLRLVNSVSFSPTHKISSFNQAITLLGRRQLQRWLQLLLYAGNHEDGSPNPLLGIAAHRAALMEALAIAQGGGREEKDRAFMAGLFSLLDVLFNAPIRNLVVPLNLDADLTTALVAHEGALGRLLDLAIAAEDKPGEALAEGLVALGISNDALLAAQRHAITWASQICRDL